ncbi:cytochrome P450 2J6-like [Ylistrum balloti]|uniref:cytochrome P450 2J6-like n=1 Tax=Ylistrum balloti TaxID=509963 RepID=UPI0029058A96|nr:cytochrome P450 2J6-like [Ylistrum balloti]
MSLSSLLSLSTLLKCLVVFFITFILLRKHFSKRAKLPPGPAGLPLIGSVLMLRNETPSELYNRLYRQYGDIFSIRMGSKLFVVINGFKSLHEVFVKRSDVFTDRPNMYLFSVLNKENGVVASSGEMWRRTRTFTLTTLKKFGFGKSSFENAIKDEIDVFLDVLQSKCGKPFDLKSSLMKSVANVICSITLGSRFDHDDQRLHELVKSTMTTAEINASVGIISVFPIMRYVPGDLLHINIFKNNLFSIWELFQECIDKQKLTLTEGVTRNFIDAFVHEQRRAGESDTVFTDDNLLLCLSDLFLAGTETSSTVLTWASIFLIRHPEVQGKMRSEISRVTGDARAPCLSDRPNMPYSEAVITEALRCGNVLPLSLPHTVSKDTVVDGYTIPKGVFVIPNVGSVLNDPREFENPEMFDPERFIDTDGNLRGHEKVALTFSLGKRVCMGEPMARIQLFLILTSLVQRFELLPEHEDCLPSLDRIEECLERRVDSAAADVISGKRHHIIVSLFVTSSQRLTLVMNSNTPASSIGRNIKQEEGTDREENDDVITGDGEEVEGDNEDEERGHVLCRGYMYQGSEDEMTASDLFGRSDMDERTF